MKPPAHIDVDPTSTEGRIQEATREWAASLRDPVYAIGVPRFAQESGPVRWGELVVFDGRQALSATLPLPTAADVGRCVSLAMVGGTGPLSMILAGATVNGAAAYTITSDYDSAIFVAVGAGLWLAR